MEKNKREKQLIYEWGMKNCSEDIFAKPDPKMESYFLQRPDGLYLREYNFDTFKDFMEELEMLWANDKIMDDSIKRIIGVAAMKNKPVSTNGENETDKDRARQDEKLPVYIYNF